MLEKSLFLVWGRHSRRAITLADELHAKINFQYEDRLQAMWLKPFCYLVYGWRTWRLLECERPHAVIVQLPPIFALLVVAIWCTWRGPKWTGHKVPYVIDCHTGTFYVLRWRWSLPIQRMLSHAALITLVASEEAQAILKHWGIDNLFLIDGIPLMSAPTGTVGIEGAMRVAIISGFGLDEPIEEIFEAARSLPHITFYMSGNPERLGRAQATKFMAQKPDNVLLTGFLSERDYVGLLKNVHGLLDLTNQPHILSCGAYEATAVGKPSVISDWPQLRNYFTHGFIYVRNTPPEIAEGITSMLAQKEQLSQDTITMRIELTGKREPAFAQLTKRLTSAMG